MIRDLEEGLVDILHVHPRGSVDAQTLRVAGTLVEEADDAGIFPRGSFSFVPLLHSRWPLLLLVDDPSKAQAPSARVPASSFTISRKGGPGPPLEWALFEGPLP